MAPCLTLIDDEAPQREDTMGNLQVLTMTPAGEQERSQVKALLCDVRGGQSVTDETVKLVFADQSVGGGAFHGIRDAHGAT